MQNNKRSYMRCYIHNKHKSFVNSPSLINELLDLIQKEAFQYLGSNATLRDFINNYSAIEDEKKKDVYKTIHKEDMQLIEKVLTVVNHPTSPKSSNLEKDSQNELEQKSQSTVEDEQDTFSTKQEEEESKSNGNELDESCDTEVEQYESSDDPEVDDVVNNLQNILKKYPQ